MADKQITPFQLTDQFTMDNFNQRINETNIALQSKPNPNLLDNWYFGNPVDQRGGYVVPPGVAYTNATTSETGTTQMYSAVDRFDGAGKAVFVYNGAVCTCDKTAAVRGYTGEGYGIDRWYLGAGTLLIKDGYVQVIGGSFSERFKTAKIIDGHIYTASWLTYEGKLHTASGVLSKDSTGWQIDHWDGNIFIGVTKHSSDTFRIEISDSTGNPINLKAAKLELGSQQTLAHQENGVWVLNEIPDYGEQLARCQRYYFKPTAAFAGPSDMIAVSSNTLYGTVAFPTQMRSTPSIKNVKFRRSSDGYVFTPTTWHIGLDGGNDGFNTIFGISGVSLITGEHYTIDYEATADL